MSALSEAQAAVDNRHKSYGHPIEDFRRIAKLWSVVLGVDVSLHQVALCMAEVKISRLMNGYQHDSWIDLAGYAECGDQVDERNAPVVTEIENF